MTTLCTADYLSSRQLEIAKATIRRYRFKRIDHVRAELAGRGIHFSRSALHRYMSELKQEDSKRLNEGTVIVLVDVATGVATTVNSVATTASLLHHIGELIPPGNPLQRA